MEFADRKVSEKTRQAKLHFYMPIFGQLPFLKLVSQRFHNFLPSHDGKYIETLLYAVNLLCSLSFPGDSGASTR
jgi:hypothetical protein